MTTPKLYADREATMRPSLECPECGTEAIPAQGRGRYDSDGNYIDHRDECRCQWCEWMWFDDIAATCECGAELIVSIDDRSAYVKTVRVGPVAPKGAEER